MLCTVKVSLVKINVIKSDYCIPGYTTGTSNSFYGMTSTAWQDLCWKVQGQPWPCDSWPSGSWCDTTFGPFVKYIVEQMTPARLVTQGLYVHSLTAWLWLLKICDSFNRQVSYHYFAIPQLSMHSTHWWWMPDWWGSIASLHLILSRRTKKMCWDMM